MPRLKSITARLSAEAEQSAEVPVVLITIRGAGLTEPVYLSSDPTVRLSSDPLTYGTRHQGIEHQFVVMGAMLPDDLPDSPPKTTYVFENVTADMAAPLRAIPPGTYASVDVTLVLASSPDVIEYQSLDMRGVHGTYDGAQVTLEVSREPQTSEPWPAGRLTKARFPGVHPL